ncbi:MULTISPECIES: DUF262 domain-containing protein [unclassified Crossiella]|uniref:DUF262 domain-containing protein n=1 Tax=unclassified Crossiella TaxID=2620835 RepID=UPI001FFFE578|nr:MULTISPECIES: DUF262 domain-containing protein [unclassified Crossiella]MCK2237110.1 DUF262 domain-containing protein [Crossiella sp. S99.2]MCK2250778.1 DUF262 domain-containing protein [Crossiella sp. S99.1]
MATYPTRLQRTINNQTANWFLDLHGNGRLDLDPPYQRRSVWNLAYKQFFIDSLIRNYPAPTIFLQVENLPGQQTMYRVIDGKQRLTALLDFVNDEFATSGYLDDLGLGGRYCSDLPDGTRISLQEYAFTVETIKGASSVELNEAFDRLNRNVARLNPQELRHARYSGAFVAKVEKLADHPLWAEIGLVTPSRVRRMLDVEMVSELYVVAMDGIQDKESLDNYYADYDEEIKGEAEADYVCDEALRRISEVANLYPFKSFRFKNLADFYSLWAAVIKIAGEGVVPEAAQIAARLTDFADEYKAQHSNRSRNYRLAVVQGSNKKTNREIRAEVLRKVILGL